MTQHLKFNAMKFTKKTEKAEKYTKIYFLDELGRKQGMLECYRTTNRLRKDDLYYIESYRDDVFQGREYTLFCLQQTLAIA
jgi:hypothetical protein